MTAIEQVKKNRSLAIEAATHKLIQLLEPSISLLEIQERGGMEVVSGSGEFTTTLDGKPIVKVEVSRADEFTMTLLA